jgi:uncharacterized membrane protein YhaH (DUF805 family)
MSATEDLPVPSDSSSGWKKDPSRPSVAADGEPIRYWDGATWTDQTGWRALDGPEDSGEVPMPHENQSKASVEPIFGFVEAVQSGFQHFFNWRGRASRPAYWWLVLAFVVVVAGPLVLIPIFGSETMIGYAGVAISPVFAFPLISAQVRRLHDTGRSGAWWFVRFVPVIGWFWLLVYLLDESDQGPNKYGPNPHGRASDDTRPRPARRYPDL